MKELDIIKSDIDKRAGKFSLQKIKNNKFIAFFLQKRLVFNLIFLLALFLGNCFASWVSYPAFIFLALISLFDNLENGLSFLLFCLPFSLIYPFLSLIIYFCAIGIYAIKFYLIYFIKDKGKFDWTVAIFALLFLIYALLPIGPYDMNLLLKLAIILVLYLALFAMGKRWKVFRFALNLRLVACSILLSCLFGALVFVSPYLQSIIDLPTANGLYRFQALTTNTNVLAMLCEIVLGILAYQIIKEKRVVDGILFVGVALAGVFTFSKLYFITLGIILIGLFVGMLFVNWKRTLLVASIFLGILAAAIVAIYFVKPEFLKSIIARFGDFSGTFDEIMNKFTTSRWHLWQETFSYWGAHPICIFFGRGLGANAVPKLPFSAHNAYISMIDQLGIVGAVLFIVPLVLLFRNLAKSEDTKISKAIIIPIIVLATIFMGEDLLFYISKF